MSINEEATPQSLPEIVPGFSWIIDSELAGMKFPNEPQYYKSLIEDPFNIGLVVCVNEKLPPFVEKEPSMKIVESIEDYVKSQEFPSNSTSSGDCKPILRVAHFPIDDYGTPNNYGMVEKIIDLVSYQKKYHFGGDGSGGGTVVHCMAGLSRTGMVLACILVATRKMSPSEAIQLVNQKRGRNGKAVMTFKQEQFVVDFSNYLHPTIDVGNEC